MLDFGSLWPCDAADRLDYFVENGLATDLSWDDRPLRYAARTGGNLLAQGASVYTWDAAHRLIGATVDGVESSFAYNGLGRRVARTADGLTTAFVLDVGSELPEVIAAATGESATCYVQIQGQILAEVEEGTWEYALPDALGSLRQLADESGEVLLAQSLDPFGVLLQRAGSGGSEFGSTGEAYDHSTQLTFLRARFYDPAVGRFLSGDPFPGYAQRPASLRAYTYGYNDPIRYVDPSGYLGEPAVPDRTAWTQSGGLPWEFSASALQRLVDLRKHVVAAAQRHGFVPLQICVASSRQTQLRYKLAAIIYRESLGYDEEGILGPPAALIMNPSIGLGQIRPDTTAREIEKAGLLYDPGTADDPLTSAIPYTQRLQYRMTQLLGPFAQRLARIKRLSDPIFAIEYTAANMELARRQTGFNSNPQHPTLNRPMDEWEKMAAWHNQGIIDAKMIPQDEAREDFKTNILDPYLVGTYKAMTAIENLDLLGTKAQCHNGCRPIRTGTKE